MPIHRAGKLLRQSTVPGDPLLQILKFHIGIAACLLAGCATQRATEPQNAERVASGSALPLPDPGTTLRIGVEYLHPTHAVPEPRVEAVIVAKPPGRTAKHAPLLARARVEETRHTWGLSVDDLAAIDDPVERTALHFVSDLVREDERRSEREVRLPFFDWQPERTDNLQSLWSEERNENARTEWLSTDGTSLFSRPMRRMLRRVPLVSGVEVSIDDFRSSFVPMSEPYRKTHRAERRLGRLSLRLHPSRGGDPAEVVYIRRGLRFGSSRDTGKLTVEWSLGKDLSLTFRARHRWDSGKDSMRTDLAYRLSPQTSLRLSAGDDMDFLSTSSAYSLFETPMDGSPGLVLYAVHVF